MHNYKLSVIIPAYNEEGNIAALVARLVPAIEFCPDYEIIFVDDGSTDDSLEILRNLHLSNPKLNYISLSRNFGHQNAIRAGLNKSTGDCIVTMDADLQHPPELIQSMIDKWIEGYHIVYTVRRQGNLSFFKKITSKLFYKVINRLADIKLEQGSADFRLLDRSVVGILNEMHENSLFLRGMVSWLGFKQFSIDYKPEDRNWGKTKYPTNKMLRFAITGITSFSMKPLQISTLLGTIIASFAFIYGSIAVIMKLFTNTTVSGWTSLLVSVLFIGGIQLIMLGIIGEYLGNIFIETKKRPNFIIKEKSLD